MRGGEVPPDWKKSRIALIHKGGDRREIKNYRPVAIVGIMYKLFMMILRGRIEKWAEKRGILGERQGGFRIGKQTEDNLFILERLLELSKGRGGELFVGCLDLEKAYDRVSRGKLFDVLERYGLSPELVRVMKKIYSENEVKLVLDDLETGWITSKSGVRQGCPLSPVLFNIYVADLERVLQKSEDGIRITVEKEEEGSFEKKCVAGMLYADDVCIVGKTKEMIQATLDRLMKVVEEYGMSLSEKKSMVVVLNGDIQERTWKAGEKIIKETSEAKYLGVKIEGGKNGGLRVLSERMKSASRIEGMVKFAAKRSGSRFVIGREGWKSMVVSRLMYGAGAVVWKPAERQRLERMQVDFGRWMWRAQKSVRNGCIHGESGWSSFEEREVKAKMNYVKRILKGDDFVAEVGRASLMEMGRRSDWWKAVEKMAEENNFEEITNLIWLRRLSNIGMEQLGLSEKWMEELGKGKVKGKIEERGRKKWEGSLQRNERTREYAKNKKELKLEAYADGSDGARVRMMVRGDSLLVRSNPNVAWKYDDSERLCVCGEEETERHLLFVCNRYEGWREEWRSIWEREKGNKDMMEGVLGYESLERNMEMVVLRSIGGIWRERERIEKQREG